MGKLNINLESLFRKELAIYKKKKLLILLFSLPLPFLVALLAYLIGASSTVVLAVSSLGLIAVVLPYMIINFLEFKELRESEDSYPNFLRDLAQSVSSGMTLPQAIETSASTRYGALSKYVKKLHIWLSWSTPFPKAWVKFTRLLQRSELIRRVNGIILEAFHSGGDIKSTLNSLAEDVNLLKEMEKDKRSIMRQQIIIMYVIFFIFVGVIIGLFKILSPILFIQRLGVFSGITLKSTQGTLTINYFKDLFFLLTLIESICAGLIAGQISEEKLIAGVKHVLIMVAVGSFLFFVFIFPTHLSLEASIYPSSVPINSPIQLVGQVYYESAPAVGATVNIVKPTGEIVTVFADNVGEFKRTITSPSQPGTYKISVSVEYKNEEEVVTRVVTVTS